MKKRTIILSAMIISALILTLSACFKPSEVEGTIDPSLYERDATENDYVFRRSHCAFDGSYRSMLSEDEKRFYDALAQKILVEDEKNYVSIDVSDMRFIFKEWYQLKNMSDMAGYAFHEDHPEVYWISLPMALYSADNLKTVSYQLTSSYSGVYFERELVNKGIDDAVSEILASRASDSRYDTVKAIHDYVCNNLSYHYDGNYLSRVQQTCAPLFGGGDIGKEAVCEGYAKAFKVLCSRLDVPCVVISSRGHAYNYVQMEDGLYYAVDCTWDDYEGGFSYTYFLVGEKTILYDFFRKKEDAWRFNSEFDHVEYVNYCSSEIDNRPFVYPPLSQKAYSTIELLGDAGDPEATVSGIVTFKFRYKGNDFKGKSAKILLNNRKIDAPKIDENGYFETTYDTTLLNNGGSSIRAVVDDKELCQNFYVYNKQIEILDWGDEIPAINKPFLVRVKGYSTGDIRECKIAVCMDAWLDISGNTIGTNRHSTYSFDKDGIASFVIDPKTCGDGLHSISFNFIRPDSYNRGVDLYLAEFRSFRISTTDPDSGKLRFSGNSARRDRSVGSWADFTLKYDGDITEKCRLTVTIDGEDVSLLRQDGKKITDIFDRDGYGTFWIDVTGQTNGKHTIEATFTNDAGSSVIAKNTINVTNDYFDYELWYYNDDRELVRYTDMNEVMNGYIHVELKNTTGERGDRCRFTMVEDDLIVSDLMMTEGLNFSFWDGDEYTWEVTTPYINFGDHVYKVIFKAPDGTIVEKGLPFRIKPYPRFADNLHFSIINPEEIRNVGHTVDFTLIYDTPFPDCKSLSIMVDGNPADVELPDDPALIFDEFGRFSFLVDFPNDQPGEHTVTALLTKSDGAEMTAEQKVFVKYDCFEVMNWPGENPTLHRVYDVKVKKTVETKPHAVVQDKPFSIHQYIDGEYMGAGAFDDEDVFATLGLNTAGLEKGEHLYKLIFSYNDGKTVERAMRFTVE